MQNIIELEMKKAMAMAFGVWGLKTSLGQLGPKLFDKGFIKPQVKKPSSNFTNRTSLFQES